MAAKVTVQADEDMFNIETGATLTRYDISRYPERFATRKLPGWSTMSKKGGLECEHRVERCITCPERPWWHSSGICSESAARNRKSPQRSTKTEVPQVEPTSWGTYRNVYVEDENISKKNSKNVGFLIFLTSTKFFLFTELLGMNWSELSGLSVFHVFQSLIETVGSKVQGGSQEGQHHQHKAHNQGCQRGRFGVEEDQ